jgi:hypothetical protein
VICIDDATQIIQFGVQLRGWVFLGIPVAPAYPTKTVAAESAIIQMQQTYAGLGGEQGLSPLDGFQEIPRQAHDLRPCCEVI